jgi:serine/threonine protein kinase
MTEGAARMVVSRYHLLRALGRGGMGAVWEARDTLLGRDVAVKEIFLPGAGNGPADLAPERINGRPATAAADLWALGVTLYATLTGRSPFQREDTQATTAAILTGRPAPPAHAGGSGRYSRACWRRIRHAGRPSSRPGRCWSWGSTADGKISPRGQPR